MGRDLTDLDREKYAIVRESFIDTADDNYIAARWCFQNKLNVDFKWLSVHALEKYMKAALVLNGVSVKNFRHNVEDIYLKLQQVAGDLLPATLMKPGRLWLPFWRDESPARYLRRLYQDGNADNRYMLFGYTRFQEDIHKLDALVFRIRRICEFLDHYHLSPHVRQSAARGGPDTSLERTMREYLAGLPDYWDEVAGGRLAGTINGHRGEYLRNVALDWNMAFAPSDFVHSESRATISAHNSVILRHILEPLGTCQAAARRTLASELCDWLVENVRLPRDLVEELRKAQKGHDPLPPLQEFEP